MGVDDSALAESVVIHAETLCEHESNLWDIIRKVSIPVSKLTDTRNQNKITFGTEPLVRAFLYQHAKGISQNELAARLNTRPSLVKTCGFDIQDLANAPQQGTINHAWRQFSRKTRESIKAAATGIAQVAVEEDIITESLVAVDPSKDDSEQTEQEAHRQKTAKTIKLARKHAFPEFESGRAINRTYEDEDILEMVARACSHCGSAHSEGEYGWLTDDDQTAHGSTILRVLKQFSTPKDADAQLTIEDLLQDDNMPEIDSIRDELMKSFDAGVNNIISSIQGGWAVHGS